MSCVLHSIRAVQSGRVFASQRYSFDSHIVQAQVQPINSMVGDKPEKPRKHDPSDCSTMSISIIANVPSDSMYMLKASTHTSRVLTRPLGDVFAPFGY